VPVDIAKLRSRVANLTLAIQDRELLAAAADELALLRHLADVVRCEDQEMVREIDYATFKVTAVKYTDPCGHCDICKALAAYRALGEKP
jgi:hypothetical protein